MADSLRDMINTGAQIIGSRDADGLSPDEVADALISAQELKEAQKGEAYRAAMIRRRRNQEAAGADADQYLDAAENFETKGRFEAQERYPDPFGIPVSPADPEPNESKTKDQDKRRERGGAVLVRGREDLAAARGKSAREVNSLVADGAIRREWRERPGLAPGAVDPFQPANRQQLFTDPKYVGGRPNDDVSSEDGRNKARMAPAGIGMGGPNGLATQLADMVSRGELDPNTVLPNPNPGRDVNGNALPDANPRTVQNLIDEMAQAADPQLVAEADKAIGKQTAQRDAARFDPGLQELQNRKAAREAEANRQRFNPVNDFSDIGNIQSLGIASKKFNRGSNMSIFNVVPNADGEITDRDGGIDQMVQYLAETEDAMNDGRIPAGASIPSTDTGSRTTVGARNLAEAIQMIGPEGETVGYADNQGRFLGDVDISPSAQPPTRTQAWLEASLPDMGRAGGTSFGYPQVNIGDTLNLLTQRLGPNAPEGGIRSLEDLENTFVRMIDSRLDKGGTLFNFDPEQNKAVAIADPGIDEVLYALNYTKNEKAQLANALMQQEAARVSPVNQGFKHLYEQGIYDPRGQFVANNFDNSVSLGRMAGEKVGRGDNKGDRVSVRKSLEALDGKSEVLANRGDSPLYGVTPYDTVDTDDFGNVIHRFRKGDRALLPEVQQDLIDAEEGLADAQKPFQGARAGSKPPKQAFIRGDARGMSQSALAGRMGAERAALAQGVESRYLADERRRNTPEVTSTGRRAIKDKDIRVGAEGAKRREQDRINKARAIRQPGIRENVIDANKSTDEIRMDFKIPLGARFPNKEGEAKPDGWRKREREAQIIANAESAEARRLQVAAGIDLRSVGVANSQRATSAVTTQAPDPAPLAARGGWVGKQLPPGNRGGDLAIREVAAMRRNSGGSLADSRVEKVNVQVDSPPPSAPSPTVTPKPMNEERSRRTERPAGVTNRNRLIREILGTTAAGAGSVALGAAIGSAYNSNQQEEQVRY